MDSLILRTASKFLLPLLLLFSVFLLLYGHNYPGGGFAGGLMAAGALALYATAYDVPAAERVLRVEPHTLIGAGLILALLSGLVGLLAGESFLTGAWTELTLDWWGELHLGTPLLFDVGVYLVVLGVALTVLLTLLEE